MAQDLPHSHGSASNGMALTAGIAESQPEAQGVRPEDEDGHAVASYGPSSTDDQMEPREGQRSVHSESQHPPSGASKDAAPTDLEPDSPSSPNSPNSPNAPSHPYASHRSKASRHSAHSSSLVRQTNKLLEEVRSLEEELAEKDNHLKDLPWVKRVAWSPRFQSFIGLLIFVNAITIGLETDDHGAPGLWVVIENVFLLIYIFEVAVRFFADPHRAPRDLSFLFDFGIVLVGIVDGLSTVAGLGGAGAMGGGSLALLRLARLVRLGRIFRLLQFFESVWLMISALFSTLRALLFAWLFIATLIYIFGIIACRTLANSDSHPDLKEHWGNLSRSLFTLFTLVTLDDWTSVVDAIWTESGALTWAMLAFISITAFVILKIVLAVVVQATIDESVSTHEAALHGTKVGRAAKAARFFEMADLDEDGQVSKEDILLAWEDEDVREEFSDLDLHEWDVEFLLENFDVNKGGTLSKKEFTEGLVQLKGQASGKRLLLLRQDRAERESELLEMSRKMHETLDRLSRSQELIDSSMLEHGELLDHLKRASPTVDSSSGCHVLTEDAVLRTARLALQDIPQPRLEELLKGRARTRNRQSL